MRLFHDLWSKICSFNLLVPSLLVGAVLLILIFYFVSSYLSNFVSKPMPSTKPAAQSISGWQTFSDSNFGVSFQYPPEGRAYVGSRQGTNDPEVEIDLQTKCQDETPSFFSVLRSRNSPNASINQLTEKVEVGGIAGLGSADKNSGGQRISLKSGDFYYLLKFITCEPSLNQKILSTFQFTN